MVYVHILFAVKVYLASIYVAHCIAYFNSTFESE